MAKVKGARPVRVSKVEGSWTWVFFKCPSEETFVIPMNNALSYYSYPAEINFYIKSFMIPSTKYNPDPQQSNFYGEVKMIQASGPVSSTTTFSTTLPSP